MVHVRNFTKRAIKVPLVLSLGEKTLLRDEIEIGADDRRVLIYPFDGSLTGALTAQLEIDDDFATDNRAYLAVNDAPTVRLLYIGPGNPYLSNLLRLFANVELTERRAGRLEFVRTQKPFDVVIFDRVPVPALTQGNFILIDAVAPNLPIQLRERFYRRA